MKKKLFIYIFSAFILIFCLGAWSIDEPDQSAETSHSQYGSWFSSSSRGTQVSYQELNTMLFQINQWIGEGKWDWPYSGANTYWPIAHIVEKTDTYGTYYVIQVSYSDSSAKSTYTYYYSSCIVTKTTSLTYQYSYSVYYAVSNTEDNGILKPLYTILNYIKSKVDDLVSFISDISGKVTNIYNSIGVKSSSYTILSDLHTVQQRVTTINTSCTSIKASLINIDANITTIDANISGIATACANMETNISGIASAVANMNNSFTLGGIHLNTSSSDPLYTSVLPDNLFSTPYSTYDGDNLPTVVIPYESGTALISDINSDMQLAPITHITNDGTSTSTRYILSSYLDDSNYIRVYTRGSSPSSTAYTGYLCDERQRLYKVDPQSYGVDHWSDFVNMMSTVQQTLSNIHSRLGDMNSSLDRINSSVSSVDRSINLLLNYVDNQDFINVPRLNTWLTDYSTFLSQILTTPIEKYFVKMFGSTWLFDNLPNDNNIMPYIENPWGGYNYVSAS